MHDSGMKKFGEIISKVLEKEWPLKDKSAGDDQAEIMKFALTWPTFPRYLKLFCKSACQSSGFCIRCFANSNVKQRND